MAKLYIGNLAYSVNDSELNDMFAQFGNIVSATVIVDKMSGRSKGFGFVEFDNEDSAKSAIEAMNGKDMGGRNIVVSEARPMEDRPKRPPFKRDGGDRRY